MMSDSIVNASIPITSKDFGKKKRANRSAKLKQCKLDARREQWLSQVVKIKDGAASPGGGGGGGCGVGFDGQTIEIRKKAAHSCKGLKVGGLSVQEIQHESDSESSPATSPLSSVSGGNDSGSGYTASSRSSSSSGSFGFSSGGSCSGSLTEEEESGDGGSGGGEDGCLDDWEAMADALAANVDDKEGRDLGVDLSPVKESGSGLDSLMQLSSCGNVDAQAGKLKLESAGILGKGGMSNKAWRPDDTCRPQSLPNLAKQRSFPTNSERLPCNEVNPWVRVNVPTLCPICCEDLDLTDSSFLPCLCRFRLCLFCHKRILEDDGRCPGCRKPYASNSVEKETSVRGGSLAVRLTRSCSMFPRV